MSPAGLNSIPDSHFWSGIHDIPTVDATGPNALPIIDLADPDAVNLVGQACESWGIFQVINHGIPVHLFGCIESEARRLFALPTEEKMKAASTPGSMEGYQVGKLIFPPSFFPKMMWMERFVAGDSSHEQVRKLWPEDPSQFCDVVEEYREEMVGLTRKLLVLMLLSLGLTDAEIKQGDPIALPKIAASPLKLHWYPDCPEPECALGLATHTDSGLIALVYNESPGLQVLHGPDQHGPSRWVNVPPLPGAIVVTVGDMAHIFSNGRFLNVAHRVIVNQAQARFSTVYLQYPPDNVMLSPIVRGLTGRPMYRDVTWSKFLETKHKMKNFENTLPFIKLAEENLNE